MFSQDEKYFQRMSASSDKNELITLIKRGSTVLDVGCGEGTLLSKLSDVSDATGIDGSSDSVRRARETAPKATVIESYVHDLLNHFSVDSFDTIVCSSILHEVYSYGDGHGTFDINAVVKAFRFFRMLLKPEGQLIIRDGIIPSNWDMMVTCSFKNPDDVRLAEEYRQLIPFKGDGYRKVNFSISGNTITGNYESIMEFLYTYTWGEKSFPRETQELYGVNTLEQYKQFGMEHGFTPTYATEYTQNGYVRRLSPKVTLTDASHNVIPFPPTNCVLVFKKER